MRHRLFSLSMLLSGVIVFTTSQLKAMPDPHDSLLFDGENRTVIPTISDDCNITVTKVEGRVWATRVIDEEIKGCGGETIIQRKYVKGQINEGEKLKLGDEIEAGPDGMVKLTLWDGSVIMFSPNTKFTIVSDVCKDITILMRFGSIWTWVKKQLGGAKYEVTTDRDAGGVRGTKFSFEVKVKGADTVDILKVYEGKVEMSLKQKEMKEADDYAKKMEQLANDLQSGKISMEEFQAKVMEYKNQMENQASEMLPVTVEASYKCTATKNSLKVEPIESNDDRWWEKIYWE